MFQKHIQITCFVFFPVFLLCSCYASVFLNNPDYINYDDENSKFNYENPRPVNTHIMLESPIKITNDRFLSVTLAAGIIRDNWAHFDTSSVKLKTLAKGLSPVYLRVGGTSSDFLVFRNVEELGKKLDFVNNDAPDWEDLQRPVNTTFNMTMFDWVYLNKFVQSIPGWLLIFDLNVLQRTNNHWDPSINASKLLVESSERGYCLAGLELGNEPDAFRHLLGYSIDATVLGNDFRHLARLKSLVPCMGNSLVIGPDVTAQSMRKRKHELFLREFLITAHTSLDVVTIHHYYVNGRTATADQFMDPDILDRLQTELNVAFTILNDTCPGKPLWFGETSSAFGGGSPGLSDVYIAGFMWMDKLGLSARTGVEVVMRQSFYKGHYALLDFRTLDPNPDYWLSLLFKKLVGNNVLNVSTDDPERKVRFYAHCTKTPRNPNPKNESVTLYGMNLYEEDIMLKLPQFTKDQELYIYKLEPDGVEGIFSKNVNLNGDLLQLLNENHELPPLKPAMQKSNNIRLSPRSLVFIVVPKIDAPACRSPKPATFSKSKDFQNTSDTILQVVKDILVLLKFLLMRFFYLLM